MRLVNLLAGIAASSAFLVLVLILPAGAGAAGPFGERCEYVRGGPPGPRGNRLVIVGYSDPWINRRGEQIIVHEGPAPCTGPQATVHNIDRIIVMTEESEVFLSEGHGAFAPGATHERSSSEIEVFVDAAELTVYGRRGHDSMRASRLSDGDIALDLDVGADGEEPDYDVTDVSGRSVKAVKLHGRQGADLIDTRRLTGIGDNAYLKSRVKLYGEGGADTILGGRGDEMIWDGGGDDLVRAGGGDDEIEFGPGRDTIYGGSGNDALVYGSPLEANRGHPDAPDRLFGGPGADVIQDDNGHADEIRCGPGNDLLDGHGPDRGPDCEKVRHGRGDLI